MRALSSSLAERDLRRADDPIGWPAGTGPGGTSRPGRPARPRPAGRSVDGGATAGRPARLSRPRPETTARFLLWWAVVVSTFGLLAVAGLGYAADLAAGRSPWWTAAHEALYSVAGVLLLSLVARSDYRRWRRWARALLVVSFAGLVAVHAPVIGLAANGSHRWVGVGFLRVQPSEVAKAALVLFLADLLARPMGRTRGWGATLRPALGVTVALAGLVMAEPDLGTTTIILAIGFAMLWVGGLPLRHLGPLSVGGVGAVLLAGLAMPARRQRLLVFLHPWAHLQGQGWQLVNALVAISSGHLFGVGLAAGSSAFGYVPNVTTDFVFSGIGQELGFVGAAGVICAFGAFAVVGARAAGRAPDRFGGLLAAGVTIWITTQAIVNVGATLGMLPVTGVPLPLVSAGGSAMVVEAAAIGLLVSVARRGRRR